MSKGHMGTFSVVAMADGGLSYDCDLCGKCFFDQKDARAHRCPEMWFWKGDEP